jgi:hypothetical protein
LGGGQSGRCYSTPSLGALFASVASPLEGIKLSERSDQSSPRGERVVRAFGSTFHRGGRVLRTFGSLFHRGGRVLRTFGSAFPPGGKGCRSIRIEFSLRGKGCPNARVMVAIAPNATASRPPLDQQRPPRAGVPCLRSFSARGHFSHDPPRRMSRPSPHSVRRPLDVSHTPSPLLLGFPVDRRAPSM